MIDDPSGEHIDHLIGGHDHGICVRRASDAARDQQSGKIAAGRGTPAEALIDIHGYPNSFLYSFETRKVITSQA
jgi:hypothetical protein